MLMHVADSLGFRINTFTHILEGYKVADKLAEHGAAGSTFSDWWAYKYEVKDAIPYNGAVLHGQGVLTGFNSDDAEMARRLNQEAAKAMKYGGVSEEDAWKFVTLNPARMLHIDDRVGSIAPGKDADLVLWDGPPMSIYTRAEQTWVDGRCEFSLEEDAQLRAAVQAERARLIQAMLADPSDDRQTPAFKPAFHYHCDTQLEETR
jgi:imidazolonepropionase-like amidohydrolase